MPTRIVGRVPRPVYTNTRLLVIYEDTPGMKVRDASRDECGRDMSIQKVRDNTYGSASGASGASSHAMRFFFIMPIEMD